MGLTYPPGEKGHAPFASDRSVRVICERSVNEEEDCREGRDRVGGRRRGERPEDGCKCDEREEDEQGRLDRARTWAPNQHQRQLCTQSGNTNLRRSEGVLVSASLPK